LDETSDLGGESAELAGIQSATGGARKNARPKLNDDARHEEQSYSMSAGI
jgi:hypothetical protein